MPITRTPDARSISLARDTFFHLRYRPNGRRRRSAAPIKKGMVIMQRARTTDPPTHPKKEKAAPAAPAKKTMLIACRARAFIVQTILLLLKRFFQNPPDCRKIHNARRQK